MNKFVFNHAYKLKHDKKRTYIIGPNEKVDGVIADYQVGWLSKIHPLYAMILSFFTNPIEKECAIKSISSFLNISIASSEKLIDKLCNNNDKVVINYNGTYNVFPVNILTDSSNVQIERHFDYRPNDFIFNEIELKQTRPYLNPWGGVVFMINNKCATDCLYCYADKSFGHPTMPFELIEKLIKDCYDRKIPSFTLTGGEFFIYNKWDKLLDTLIMYNYKPSLISTKVPLEESDILRFKKYSIQLQVSLDSLSSEELQSILNVNKDYRNRIINTILLAEKHDIKFQIATVITNLNCSLDNLVKLYHFLKEFKNLVRWEIRIAFRSLYSRCDFDTFLVSKEKIQIIDDWVNEQKNNPQNKCNILWVKDGGRKYFNSTTGSKGFSGSRCSANYSHMVVMPDGKVTICEQLYWKEKFIIGDVTKQSIEEIWNSKTALDLAFPKQSEISDKSACKKCKMFSSCLDYPNKCYADVIKGYGEENWDFPDPRCAKAPEFSNTMLI